MKSKKIYINKTFSILHKTVNKIREIDGLYLGITSIITIFSSLLPVVSLKVMQQIVNFIQGQMQDFHIIVVLILIYLSLDLISILVEAMFAFYKQKYVLQFNLELKKELLEKASRLTLRDYENSEIYDKLQRAENQSDCSLITFFDRFIGIIGLLISVISYGIIVIRFKAWLIPLLLFIPIIRFCISNRINTEEFYIVKKRTDDERKAWYDSYIITCGINYKELRIYNLFGFFIDKFSTLSDKFIKEDLYIAQKRLKYMTLLNLGEQLLVGVLFAYTIFCGLVGSILIGDVITYTKAMISSKGQFQSAIQGLSEMNKSSLFIEQLFEFLELEEDNAEGTVTIDEIKRIEVRNLSYRYPNSTVYALKNISLCIEKNDFIAVVGRNGSGKSTLMKILLGLYTDYEGEIFVNDINFKDINLETYQRHIGSLFQDFTKYEGSIRENVCYSNLDMINCNEKISAICEHFGLKSLIENQKEGLDTQLGYWFESGKQISFGQWQKLALCRTFAREGDLYFLDEPNATIDAISESEMAKLYEDIFDGKLGVMIVHRFNHFVNNANKIIVLKDGELVGQGNHKELSTTCEEYSALFEAQMNEQ